MAHFTHPTLSNVEQAECQRSRWVVNWDEAMLRRHIVAARFDCCAQGDMKVGVMSGEQGERDAAVIRSG
jgi:hypothetical protein